MLGCSAAQAAALQRYVVLVCVIKLRERREIPCARERAMAKALLRCIEPKLKLAMGDALRYAL